MPRPVADSVIVISSSSSSEEEGKGHGGSTSRARHVHHSAAASVGGEKGDGVKKSKKRKEENGAAIIGEDRRGREESGPERKAKPKAPRKKQNKGEEKEKKAPLSSAEAVTSGGAFARPSIIFALPASPVMRPTSGGKGDGGNGGKNMDRVRKDKRKEREEGPSAVGGGVALREGEETKAKTKRKKQEDKKKKATFPLRYADVNGAEAGHPSAVYSSPTNPDIHLVAGGGGGKKTDGVKKKKKRNVETSAVANGKVRGKGEERKSNVKKKDKNGEDTEKKASSSSSYAGDVVATSGEVGRPSPTCSFPMRRVKRLIAGSEDGGRKSSVRTSLDAVFLINKASEFFLELFAQDAYAHAAQEHKRALFYKHLSSTVCDEKRYEFLSDFVPEKVRAEDALKAMSGQP